MFEELKKHGYKVVEKFEGVEGIDFCHFEKNGHIFEVRHCEVRNGKQNKFFVKMDGKILATRCLLYDAIIKMEQFATQE